MSLSSYQRDTYQIDFKYRRTLIQLSSYQRDNYQIVFKSQWMILIWLSSYKGTNTRLSSNRGAVMSLVHIKGTIIRLSSNRGGHSSGCLHIKGTLINYLQIKVEDPHLVLFIQRYTHQIIFKSERRTLIWLSSYKGTIIRVFFDFSLTVKAAPRECVIRTGQPQT